MFAPGVDRNVRRRAITEISGCGIADVWQEQSRHLRVSNVDEVTT
eukprot:COSAG02_NODE_71747_length_189_cov_205.355556_1_plen_44_part_10